MYNWGVDLKQLKKNKKQYAIWKIEQMVNFGLNGEKIKKNALLRYWKKLRLDPIKKKYLAAILWPRQ